MSATILYYLSRARPGTSINALRSLIRLFKYGQFGRRAEIEIKTSMAAFGCRLHHGHSRVRSENDRVALMKSNETNSRRAISGYRLVPLASRRAVSHLAACAVRCIHLRARLMNWHRPINPVPSGYYVPDSLPLLHTQLCSLFLRVRQRDTSIPPVICPRCIYVKRTPASRYLKVRSSIQGN